MKFKRYIREADMDRRERIASAIQNRKNRISQGDKGGLEDKTQYIWEELKKFSSKSKEMGKTIRNVQECGSDILFERWFANYLEDEFDEDGVCIKYDDYVFVVYPNGTFVVFFNNKHIIHYLDGEEYQDWVYDCIGNIGQKEDDKSKMDKIRNISKAVSLFDKFEDAFYDYVEEKLQED